MPRRPHVALLVETSREYGRGLLRGISHYVRVHGPWSLYLQARGAEDPLPPWLQTWKGDGILARVESEAMGHAIRACKVPAIDLRGAFDVNIPLVETDDQAVTKLAVEHFAERGFRHFAYCGYAGANYSERRLRYFTPLVEAAGGIAHVYQTPVRQRAVLIATREQLALLFEDELLDWLRGLPRPVGIMACNDVRGQQVLNACRELDIGVPDSVAVIGVDNDPFHCELSDPPLSSVVPNTERIGYMGAELLDAMMQGGTAPKPKTFVAPLGVATRQSTDVLAVEDADVAAAVRYIREHACEQITVDQVLTHVPLSRRDLERRFRKYLRRSPHEEITRVKVKRAQELLAETDLPISTVAVRAGFRHAEYMTAVFRKQLGQKPRAYREERAARP